MLKVDAHSHVGKGAAVWSGQDVVNRMDAMKVDKTIIFRLRKDTLTMTRSWITWMRIRTG